MIEVAGLHVEVVRLQIAELRRQRIEAVVRQDDRLCVLQLREDARREDVVVIAAYSSCSRSSVCFAAVARPVSSEMCAPSPGFATGCSAPSADRARPQSSAAVRAVNSSLVARNSFVRKHWSSVRQLSSPGSADRSELMLCVATIGISRAWRDSANVRSSPVGSVSPTVAKAWYSSQTNSRSRHDALGMGRDLRDALQHRALEIELQHHAEAAGQRRDSARPESSAPSTWPRLEQVVERRQRPWLAGLRRVRRTHVRGGQNARWTAGFSSNSDRNTTTPSTIDDREPSVEPDSSRGGTSARPPRADGDDRRRSRAVARAHLEGDTCAPARYVSSSASYGCAMCVGAVGEPVRPRRLADRSASSPRRAIDDHFRRLRELRS